MSNNNVIFKYNKVKLKYENLVISNIEVSKHNSISEFELKPWECRMYKI